MINRESIRLFAGVVKLVAFFLLYQYLFVVLGRLGSFVAFRMHVSDVSYEQFTYSPTALMSQYATMGMAVGVFLSSLAMILHLLLFGYVKFSRNIFSEVKGSVLLLSVFFIGSMMMVFNIIAAWLGLDNNMEAVHEQLLGNGFGVLSMAVLAPVLEELLFRGAIQGALMRYFRSPWVGIVVASLLFGIIHLNPVQVFYATCLGIGFGWVYYRTGSLLPAILGHIINNSLAVCGAILFGSEMDAAATGSAAYDIRIVFVASLWMLVLVLAINRLQPPVPRPWHDVSEN